MHPKRISWFWLLSYSWFGGRQTSESGTTALVYKSTERAQLEAEGYRIVGNMGDQWSDLFGTNVGNRTFKVPDPMYYISWNFIMILWLKTSRANWKHLISYNFSSMLCTMPSFWLWILIKCYFEGSILGVCCALK